MAKKNTPQKPQPPTPAKRQGNKNIPQKYRSTPKPKETGKGGDSNKKSGGGTDDRT